MQQQQRNCTRKRRGTERTERRDTETETAGGAAGPLQSRYKKGYMTNIYLTDSGGDAIVDFVKDY